MHGAVNLGGEKATRSINPFIYTCTKPKTLDLVWLHYVRFLTLKEILIKTKLFLMCRLLIRYLAEESGEKGLQNRVLSLCAFYSADKMKDIVS